MRELLVAAVNGKVHGYAFTVEFEDGSQKTGFTGRYRNDPEEAVRVANRMSQRLTHLEDAAIGDHHEAGNSSFVRIADELRNYAAGHRCPEPRGPGYR